MRIRIFIVMLLAFAVVASAGARAQMVSAELISIQTRENQDILKIKLSQPRTPAVSRLGAKNRIVFTFEDAAAMSSLKSLSGKQRGSCVEKFEIQMFMRGAATIPGKSVPAPAARPSVMLIAYVENDVDAEVSVDYDEVTIHFFRIGVEPTQNRPLPFISVEEFGFSREGAHEIFTINTSAPITPSIYEVIKPHRILLTFNNSIMSDRARNQIRHHMQSPTLARAEAFDISSLPRPYDSELDGREFHFIGFPPQFRTDDFTQLEPGYQSNSAAIALFLEDDVEFSITRKGGRVFEIIFTKPPRFVDSCTLIPLDSLAPRPEKLPELYPVEDEHGRKFIVPLDID